MMVAVNTINKNPGSAEQPANREAVAWLLAIASHRDRDAFEQLYGHYAPKIKTYMTRKGADSATADDLAQETMVQVWRKAEQYDPKRAAPSAWIFTVARNLRIDKLRRQRLHEVELTTEADQVVEAGEGHAEASDHIDALRLRGFVETLPGDQMDVVQLAFFEGLSHSEVGQRLSVPLGTVKSRLRLAFAKLRTAIGEQQ